jgi:hypothetical protein
MGTIEDLIFRIPLGRSQYSTLFLNVAQSTAQAIAVEASVTSNKIHHLQDLDPPGLAVWQ